MTKEEPVCESMPSGRSIHLLNCRTSLFTAPPKNAPFSLVKVSVRIISSVLINSWYLVVLMLRFDGVSMYQL